MHHAYMVHMAHLEIWKFRYMDFGIFICSKIMEFDLKWVHMARYELILKQDGAIWLRIILKPLLAPKGATSDKKIGIRVTAADGGRSGVLCI